MRIQNNITAMNTHRMYTINNDNVAKSAEKLSSGYRINRAGDDAAGLAISEKMRSQIRGLNMATKNSQDAISLVQTAEGALQETHSMLQRMNELAVQAATGTNEGFDRTQAAKEFEQLKREINDVAEQTNFNNMKILDGSLSYGGYDRSYATAGVNKTVATTNDRVGGATGSGTAMTPIVENKATANSTYAAGKYTAGDTTALTAASFTETLKKGDAVQFEITVDGKKFTSEMSTTLNNANAGGTNDPDISDISAAIGTNGLKLHDENGKEIGTLKMTTGGKLTIEGPTANTDDPGYSIKWSSGEVEIGYKIHGSGDREGKTGTVTVPASSNGTAGTDTKDQLTGANGTPASTIYQFNLSSVKVGDTLTIGDKTYEIVDSATELETDGTVSADSDNIGVKWNGATDDTSDLVKNLADAINNHVPQTGDPAANMLATNGAVAKGTTMLELTGATTVQQTVGAAGATGQPAAGAISDPTEALANANKEVVLEYKGVSGGADAAEDSPLNGRTNTIEFDVAKMKKGDTFKFDVEFSDGTKKSTSVTFEGESRAKFMEKVRKELGQDQKDAAKQLGDVTGNALIIKNADVKIELDESWKQQDYASTTNAIRIQVGANENEQLALSIDSMNTAGLGLDNAFLTVVGQSTDQNIDSAGAAITAVKAAINKVSDQRATLGAMQNRLDHKIANLKVASENLSASESRIRDVDMASEMTNFTKNNILSQAATAMLAQANALPQNVLSLLG